MSDQESCTVAAFLPNQRVILTEHSRKHSVRQSQSHTRAAVQQQRSYRRQSELNWPHFTFCTYILDIVSGYDFVVTINRPFGYNNDIQPFHSCSVLQGGVVEKQHDRKTETVAVTWAQKHRDQTTPSAQELQMDWLVMEAASVYIS